MKQTILVDGFAVLYSCFWATMPKKYFSLRTDEIVQSDDVLKNVMKTGTTYTNGAYLMTKILLNLIKAYKPDAVAVCWDCAGETERSKLAGGTYKINRPAMPKIMVGQISIVKEFCRSAGISQFEDPQFEADDLLYSLSVRMAEFGQVRILTKDTDLLRACSENVTVLLMTARASQRRAMMVPEAFADGVEFLEKMWCNSFPKDIFEFTVDAVVQEYGIRPDQFADYKALAGDACDSIPGIKGIGGKTAAALLQGYDNIDALYEAVDALPEGKENIAGNGKWVSAKLLRDGRESAFLSRQLATLAIIKPEMPNLFDGNPGTGVMVNSIGSFLLKYNFSSLAKPLSMIDQLYKEETA